jgi:1-pyrroline-4-hydroxy-2-carboxylate deaminase
MTLDWSGVFPAMTTPFDADQQVDLVAAAAHVDGLIAAGVHGLIVLGSLGENGALEPSEKLAILSTAVDVARGRVPVIAGVAEASTARACRFVREAEKAGAAGLMVLPAMIYKSDPRETIAHFRTVARASRLPVLCYNNPVAYGVDLTPAMFAELADEETLAAIKESSGDVRRITELANRCGDRYALLMGMDDLILEGVAAGVDGWVAGLVNAFPEETMRFWKLAAAGRFEEARELYRWFAPLLHLDALPKFVQYIKLAQQERGRGSERVRAPRLPLAGEERETILDLIRRAVAARPVVPA